MMKLPVGHLYLWLVWNQVTVYPSTMVIVSCRTSVPRKGRVNVNRITITTYSSHTFTSTFYSTTTRFSWTSTRKASRLSFFVIIHPRSTALTNWKFCTSLLTKSSSWTRNRLTCDTTHFCYTTFWTVMTDGTGIFLEVASACSEQYVNNCILSLI